MSLTLTLSLSGTAVLKSDLSGSLAANTADISTLKSDLARLVTSLQHKLVELETNTSAKIRGIVLDVLATVSHGRPETRFFGDWLTANFLTREQFNVSLEIVITLVHSFYMYTIITIYW